MKNKPFIKSKNFNWQGFISLLVFLSFLIMLFSGIVLYIAPEGSFARWTGWTVLGLSKANWELQHTIFSYVFSIAALLHIFIYNIIPLLSYFKKKPKIGFPLELLIAMFLIGGVFWMTQNELQPFRFIDKWGGDISDQWETKHDQPPFPEAEEMTFLELSNKFPGVSAKKIENRLKRRGIEVENTAQTMMEIAVQNETTPLKVYQTVDEIIEKIKTEQSE